MKQLINSVLKVISKLLLKKFSSNRKDEDLDQALKLKRLIDGSSITSDFVEKFIVPNSIERRFLERTNIDTDYKSIPLYIALKERLGYGFKWEPIAMAHDGKYLRCARGRLVVSISRSSKILYNLKIATAFTLWMLSCTVSAHGGFTLPVDGPLAQRFSTFGLSAILFVCGTAMLLRPGIERMISATIIERRLTNRR